MAYLKDYKNGVIVSKKKKKNKWEHEMKRKMYNFQIIIYTVDASKYKNI